MNNIEFYCQSCGANWTKGNYKLGCKECGGGALTRVCIICDGKYGNLWNKMPLDSNDSHEGHWMGFCGLSPDEQFEFIQRKMKEENV